VIDPDKCIGSLSCLSVCPEGDVLGVIDGKAALINASSCIGHGKCEVECPVDAISLVFGTSERGVDLPSVDEFFQSSRPGVHIVGELGGMGLIKNAMTQGLQCAAHLGSTIQKSSSDENDVVIVGAGASGLATAMGCQKAGLRFRVLEQDSIGGTIAHYPRQKVVMTEKVELPFYGKFGNTLISKEELLESWGKAITQAGLKIETGVKVNRIDGSDGAFEVQTSAGVVKGRKVVLAVGRRGSPRLLGVKGDGLPKVAYRLVDTAQYERNRVLVVGGGDAALEAAISLADETECEVVLSYRNAELGKARDANKKRFREMVEQGRITAFMPSQIMEVTPDAVMLAHGPTNRVMRLPNDYVIACLGGELPTDFLKANKIELDRHHGADGEKPKIVRGSANFDEEKEKQRRLAWALFVVGALLTAGLMWVGGEYYFLSKLDRAAHPLHKLLRPSGNWGHGVGIVATAFMMSNFLYSVRKRWERFKGAGRINRWLTFHQFVGVMSPVAITFHAAFQSNNVLATATAASVAVVVATGLLGRFIYGLVPSDHGRSQGLGEVKVRRERLVHRVERIGVLSTQDSPELDAFIEGVVKPPTGRTLFALFTSMPMAGLRRRRNLAHFKSGFAHHDFVDFADGITRLSRLNIQVEFFGSLKRLLSAWRLFHVVLALLLVVMITAHIGLSLYLGYKWVFQ
jgi:thioredoxin reductase/NAD-dependent dihydropyrimidine dehydrogenase PreA subunit